MNATELKQKSITRYCWLKMPIGEFSNSWSEEDHLNHIDEGMIELANKDGFKLIEYKCINDNEFEFFDKMKLR